MQPEQHKFLYWERKNDRKKDAFLYYKVSLAVGLLSMFSYGYFDQKTNPKDVYGSHSYTDYVSNWNDMSCTIWATLNALVALFPSLPHPVYGFLSGMNAVAPTFSIGVCGAFWLLLPADRQSTDWVSLHQHAFLAIITVADLIFTGAPVRFFHIMSTWVFAGCYALNTMMVYYIFGEPRDEIYPFLKYKEDFSSALKFDLFMTFGVQSIVFSFIYTLHRLKMVIYRKLSAYNSYPDGRASESQTGLLKKAPFDEQNNRSEFDFQ